MIRKAVITAAGRGTRFLPVTRAIPKEMIPLISKPLIHYAVAEAVNAGISEIIFVTPPYRNVIKDYFDRNLELERFLEDKGKTRLLGEMRAIPEMASFFYVRQAESRGLGHAVLTARELVGDEPFAVILPDDVIDARVPALKQMLAVHQEHGTSVIAVENIEPRDSVKYGVIDPEMISLRTYRIKGLVEKPRPAEAPSSLGVVGRYILTPEIFVELEATPPGKINEIQLTDALQRLLDHQAIYALEFEGTRYDTGTPLGMLKANLALALKEPALSRELRAYLKTFI
ncbi:MAG: UTP--glucose-1-phosphate uridylyltransferase GalU [Dehalococcoidales bacterium]